MAAVGEATGVVVTRGGRGVGCGVGAAAGWVAIGGEADGEASSEVSCAAAGRIEGGEVDNIEVGEVVVVISPAGAAQAASSIKAAQASRAFMRSSGSSSLPKR